MALRNVNGMSWELNTELEMDKFAMLTQLANLYKVFNVADHETNPNFNWTKPGLAGPLGCKHIDAMICGMAAAGILSEDERENFYAIVSGEL